MFCSNKNSTNFIRMDFFKQLFMTTCDLSIQLTLSSPSFPCISFEILNLDCL